ncbi:polysaccharide pyruvyl transferase family protein [Raoultella scottii]|uniref:polysaccharide pyruvyl transferase family protein n=1 Tax=Raoultella scottii TaxID=3040937 RepID=UPI002FADB54F
MKRQVILYGAFDRYNYGDNLMPILLEKFLYKYHYEKIDSIEFVFSSIKKSDLSKYKCMPTIPMRELLNAPDGSSVIIVGGEVLGANIGILYTHVQDSLLATKILRFIRKLSPTLLNNIAHRNYDAVWDYPYIPNKDDFENNVKIIYNTVGGNPAVTEQKNIISADYVSARDGRTFKHLSNFCDPKLVPDSVLMASAVIDDEFFSTVVRKEIRDKIGNNFISVQACPYKVDFTAVQMAKELERIVDTHSVDIVLLPIGYASGHDDAIFLEKVNGCADNKFILLSELNVWEIMFVISRSKAYFGTSLHGVITAMSFIVPHFSINENIEKITSFLHTWSVSPYNKPISIFNMTEAFSLSKDNDDSDLKYATLQTQKIISESLNEIANIL